ncbi:Low temperature viability protein [Annulohypoxylon maeteangense]|uniref:Low temperature viability protein n=1 Tax=Annulohypoxylon maeteangense TaxID=1927788 RepID=UPI0020074E80|nr:Low temperature viability protein [Annulohypoxylon maeteangense]KAI0884367.1 Low temperature viability protein [Annulohypoxylon maeteangense]
MPKGKWIDKKTAQHFTLVHRPQNDPLIHDTEAPSMVLNPTALPNASKVRKLDDLASELGTDAERVRANEGEAANHGIYFDDSEYDYMQHMRDLDSGNGAGEVVFIEADSGSKNKGKGKQKQSLEDALRRLDVEDEERKRDDLFGDDFLPSKNLQHLTYQAQQNVPDAIGGFQPDMDPRLREVLEALEDEAYVDDDEDVFAELAKDGQELDDIDFEDEDGWESDDTAKPTKEFKDSSEAPDLVSAGENGDWLEDFKKFKKDQSKPAAKQFGAPSELQSSLMTTTTNGGRRKKRKGALTSQSGYSMTSSSLVRTEQLGILDARFEKIEEQYNEDDFEDGDDAASMSQISSVSSVTGPVRNDFDNILDDFLGGYSMRGKKHVRKGKWEGGTAELDEIRQGLGPARIRGRTTQPQTPGMASASASR